MIKVVMNGNVVISREFENEKKAKEYVKAVKLIDKRCGEKNTYKIIKA